MNISPKKQSSRQQIKSLLIMLFSAFAFAALLILAGLYYYGPTTTYIIDRMNIPENDK